MLSSSQTTAHHIQHCTQMQSKEWKRGGCSPIKICLLVRSIVKVQRTMTNTYLSIPSKLQACADIWAKWLCKTAFLIDADSILVAFHLDGFLLVNLLVMISHSNGLKYNQMQNLTYPTSSPSSPRHTNKKTMQKKY